MNATITPAFENNLRNELNLPQSMGYFDLETLEEEFQPSAQKKGVTVVVGVAYAIVFGLVTAMLGWYFGVFFVLAMVAKHFITKAEQSQEMDMRPLVSLQQ